MSGLYKSHKTKEARPLHLESALPPGDAVPQTLPDGCVVLRHHPVDDGASRPGDGRQVGQGQHAHLEYNSCQAQAQGQGHCADLVPVHAVTLLCLVLPQSEASPRKRSSLLLHNPGPIYHGDLRHSGKCGNNYFIRNKSCS